MSKSKKSRTYKEWIESIRVAMIVHYLQRNGVDFRVLAHTPFSQLTHAEIGMLTTLVDVFRFPYEFYSPAFALWSFLVEYNEELPF